MATLAKQARKYHHRLRDYLDALRDLNGFREFTREVRNYLRAIDAADRPRRADIASSACLTTGSSAMTSRLLFRPGAASAARRGGPA